MSWKIGLGLVSALTAMSVLSLASDYTSHKIRLRQAQQAYQRADCVQAVAEFDTILEEQALLAEGSEQQARVAAQKAECEYYLSLPEHHSVVTNAHDITDRYPNSLLGETLRTRASQQLRAVPLEQSITLPLCDRLPSLFAQNWLPQLDTQGPQLSYQCGQTALEQQQYETAANAFQLFLTQYPDHAFTPQIETAYAEAAIAQAKASGAGELPPPSALGYTPDGDTVVYIANDSPETLRLIFSGPEPRFEELLPCEDCQKYVNPSAATSCSETAPSAAYRLQPGDYQVLARSTSDHSVIPFTGEWTLAAGTGYASCFYISRSAGYPGPNSNPATQPPGFALPDSSVPNPSAPDSTDIPGFL